MIAADQIIHAFRALLGREPESDQVIAAFAAMPDLGHVLSGIMGSEEFSWRTRSGPLWQWTSTFDAIQTVLAHEDKSRRPVAGHRVNYLGVAVNVQRFLPSLNLPNAVEPPPLPANWHADVAEFAAVLRAVEHAGTRFVMAELGCGWGCWMNISGVAARRLGKSVHLVGVEGDPRHIDCAKEALATNGFTPDQYALHRGIAAARSGTAYFPKQSAGEDNWGLQPVFNPSVGEAKAIERQGRHEALPMVPLERLLGDHDRLDLLHIDIQGGETPLIRDSLAFLKERVASIVVGTHSRVIDGEIIALLEPAGWELEIERPCQFNLVGGKPVTTIDGVQGWRNPRFPSARGR